MLDKVKLFMALLFAFTLLFSATTEAYYQSTVNTCDSSITTLTNPYRLEKVELGSKKFRCKLCGRTFSSGLVMAGHIRGEHNKWLIHKYYEKI